MIELDIEQKIVESLNNKIDDYDIQSSWAYTEDQVKSEKVSGKKGVISIYVQPMSHDDFSLPTVNLQGVLTIESRVEMCPTMKEVVETFNIIKKQFSYWHYNSVDFSDLFSTPEFYATELMLTSGDKVSFDKNSNCWVVTIGFKIRGTENFEVEEN